jgi:hypothetical protein
MKSIKKIWEMCVSGQGGPEFKEDEGEKDG